MNGAREHKSNMNKPSVDYAEKVNDKYVNIEKFVNRFVCVTNKINHKESQHAIASLRLVQKSQHLGKNNEIILGHMQINC